MKSLRKKLLVSAFTLLIAVAAVATTTFAWFTMGKETQVGGIDLEVQGTDGLLIRVVSVNGETENSKLNGLDKINTFQSKVDLTEVLKNLNILLEPLTMKHHLADGAKTDFGLYKMTGTDVVEETETLTATEIQDNQKLVDAVAAEQEKVDAATKLTNQAEEEVSTKTKNKATVQGRLDDAEEAKKNILGELVVLNKKYNTGFIDKKVAIYNATVTTKPGEGSYNDQLNKAKAELMGDQDDKIAEANWDKFVDAVGKYNAVATENANLTTASSQLDEAIAAHAEKERLQKAAEKLLADKEAEKEAQTYVAKKYNVDNPVYSESANKNTGYIEIQFEFLAVADANIIITKLQAEHVGEGPVFKAPREMDLNGVTYAKGNEISEARLANALRIAYVENEVTSNTDVITPGTAWKLVSPEIYDKDHTVINGGELQEQKNKQFGLWDEVYNQEDPGALGKAAVKYYNLLTNSVLRVPGEYTYDVDGTDLKTFEDVPVAENGVKAENLTGYKASASVRIWLEGWDADCFNPLVHDTAKVEIHLTTASKTQA